MTPIQGTSRNGKLEVWFASPKFWKGDKITRFFCEAQNAVKERSDKAEIYGDLEKAANDKIWNLQNVSDWKPALGNYHFELVTVFFGDKKGECKRKGTRHRNLATFTVADVMEVIRNRHEHKDKYTETEKRNLGWWIEESDKSLRFDDDLFGKYWNDRFPNLALLLWTKFWDLKLLPGYYEELIKPIEHIQPHNFLNDVIEGLELQKNQGFLISRYEWKEKTVQLEIRTISEAIVKQILGYSSTMSAALSQGQASCNWYGSAGSVTKTNRFENCTKTCSEITIVVANKSSHIPIKQIIDNSGVSAPAFVTARKKFIVLFCHDKTTNENSYNKFIESWSKFLQASPAIRLPLTWGEIDAQTQSEVMALASVVFQRKNIKLTDLFPNKTTFLKNLLHQLADESLNKLLRKQPLEIFSRLTLPKLPEVYIQRRLSERLTVNLCDLDLERDIDLIVVYDIETEQLANLVQCQIDRIQTVRRFSDVTDLTARYVVCMEDCSHYQKDEPVQTFGVTKNIHFLKHIGNGIFKWINTIGSTHIFERAYPNFSIRCVGLCEAEFIESLFSFRSHERRVIIADQPGMGKSLTLQSIANRISSANSSVTVVYAEFNDFLEIFNVHKLSFREIHTAVSKLVSSNQFEERLFWSVFKVGNKKFKIEILLDALDEVPHDTREQAIAIMRKLSTSSIYTRVWVTVRKHMQHAINFDFKFCRYNMLPLEEDEQIEFLIRCWTLYCKRRGSKNLDFYTDTLKRIAKSVVRQSIISEGPHISGIPLQCRMLAEIYEKRVFDGEVDTIGVGIMSHTDMYDQIFARKFEVYTQEKYGISKSSQHSLIQNQKQMAKNLHEYYAMKLLVGAELANEFKTHLLPSPSFLPDPESIVLELGIISNLHPLKFVHRTFAEFILAKFFYNVITNQVHGLSAHNKSFNTILWKHVFHTKADWFGRRIFKNEPRFYFLNHLLKPHFDRVTVPACQLVIQEHVNTLLHYFRKAEYTECDTLNSPSLGSQDMILPTNISYISLTNRIELVDFMLFVLITCSSDLIQEIYDQICTFCEQIPQNSERIAHFGSAHPGSKFAKNIMTDIVNNIHAIQETLGLLVQKWPTILHGRKEGGIPSLLGGMVYPDFDDDNYDSPIYFPYYNWYLHVFMKVGAQHLTEVPRGRTAYDLAMLDVNGAFLALNLADFRQYLEKNNEEIVRFRDKQLLHCLFSSIPFFWSYEDTWLKLGGSQYLTQTMTGIIKFLRFVIPKCQPLLEERNERGFTPLLHLVLALQYNIMNESSMRLLSTMLDLNADVNAVANCNETVLHYIFYTFEGWNKNLNDCIETMQLLKKYGISRETVNTKRHMDGKTPFHTAFQYFRGSGSRHLILLLGIFKEIGADFTAKDKAGNSSLILAIKHKNRAQLVRFLVSDCHVNVHETNAEGKNALHVASEIGELRTVKFLVSDCNLDPNLKDQHGKTPINYAACEEIREFLEFQDDDLELFSEIFKNIW